MHAYRLSHVRRFAVAFVALLTFANASQASVVDNSGGGFVFPDNDPAGVSSVISIGANETITDLEVRLFNLTHTWVGDLIGTITSPDGTTADLFFRVGNGNFGDNSNLNGDYTFGDSGGSWAAAVGSVNANQNVPVGTYQASTDGDGPISLATTFAGESTAGNWTLTISDNAGQDNGSLGGWGLNITSNVSAVPEPTPLLLNVLGGVALLRRRRIRR